MKIALIGTHGTRKTTLQYALVTELKRQSKTVGIVEEIARKTSLPINQKTTIHSQLAILTRQIAEEISQELNNQILVTDRTAIDNYAYYLATVERAGVVDPFPELKNLVFRWLSSCSLVVFCQPDLQPEADGVRDTAKDFQLYIHEKIRALLGDAKVFLQKMHLAIPEIIEIPASEIVAGKEIEILQLWQGENQL